MYHARIYRAIADEQLNVGNDVDPSNMKVFEQNSTLTVGGNAATWGRNLEIFIFLPTSRTL